MDGVAGLGVGEGEFEGVAGGDADAGRGEGDARGRVVAEVDRSGGGVEATVWNWWRDGVPPPPWYFF